MDRRIPTVVVLLSLLAACSTTAPPPNVAPQTQSNEAQYLQGVTSEYSVRMDELRPDRPRHRRTALPNAVVAGDKTLTVAASLFVCDGVYALDLIIQNHGPDPLEVDRERMALFDDNGDALPCRYDWKEGHEYGLRATRDSQRAPAHLNQTFLTAHSEKGTPTLSKPNDPLSKRPTAASSSRAEPMGYDWIDEPLPNSDTLTLPSVFVLPEGENTPYWAYWRAESPRGDEEVALPLTAMVTLGNKRLFFRFEEAKTRP